MNIGSLAGFKANPSSIDGPAPPDIAVRRHHAWQSAMEQAQLSGWFKPSGDAGQQQGGQATGRPLAAGRSEAPDARREFPGPEVTDLLQPAVPRGAHAIAIAQALRPVDGSTAPPVDGVIEPRSEDERSVADIAADGDGENRSGGGGLAQGLAREVQQFVSQGVGQHAPVGGAHGSLPGAAVTPARAAQSRFAPAVSDAVGERAISARPAARIASPDAAALPASPGAGAQPFQSSGVFDAGDAVVEEARPSGAARALPQPDPRASAAAAVRVHIDWSVEGAHVWLGVDRQRLPSVAGLAHHLEQWLEAGGVKLATLVCNGRTIYTRFSQRRT